MSKHLFSHVALRHILLVPLLMILTTGSIFGAEELRGIEHLMDLGDLDHDGNVDFGAIRKQAGAQPELIAFEVSPDGQFEINWRFKMPENLVGEWVDYTLTDLNLNGRPELVAVMRHVSAVAGNKSPWLYGFEWTGEEFVYLPSFQWGWSPDNGLYARPTQIVSADLDKDGLSELVVTLSSPQSNLLILEFNGELSAPDIKIEYAGLPAAMLKTPSSIQMALSDLDGDSSQEILLFQKRQGELSTTQIKASGEDRYVTRELRSFDMKSGVTELVRPEAISSADLTDKGVNSIFLGSSKGNIYQFTMGRGGSLWYSFGEPIHQLAFSDHDHDGLQESLIRTGNRVYYFEQETASNEFTSFTSLLDGSLSATNAIAFANGLLVEEKGSFRFRAIDMQEEPVLLVEDEMDIEAESLAEPVEETPKPVPPLMEKLTRASQEELKVIPELRRKPKAPDVILHVGESFTHNIPRQEEIDPGQAYVKFKTYPEGMRLGKDFILRWNPMSDQLGYHQISYSFGQELDTTFTLYVNHIPEIFSTPPGQAQTGQQYLYQVQLEDLNEEQYFEFELISAPSGMKIDEEGLVRWLPSDTQLDSQYVSLSVSDGFERTLQKFTLYVNIPPVILEKPGPVAFINEPYVGQIGIQDKNSPNTARIIPVRTPQNLVMESSGRITWVPDAKQTGFHDILFELTDDLTTSLDSITLFVNTSPKITSRYEEHVPVGKPWNYNVEVNDPNNNQDISFLLSESSIPNLSISRRGRITWTPTEADLGRQTFTISVSDGLRDDLQKVTLYVNSPPELGSIMDTLATVARPYTTQVPVTDLNKDQELNYSFLSAPKGMTINATGAINWTPNKTQKGWNEVFVKVSDKYSSDTYKFSVYANAPPVIVSKFDTLAIATEEYRYELKALDLNTDQTLVFQIHDAPKGVELVNGNMVKWVPGIDQINQAQFKVSVTDGYITNVQKVDLFVNARPEITSTPSAVVLTDREYRYKLSSRDLNEDSIVYSKVALPNGAQLNAEEGLITWTPDGSNEGSNTFIIELTDSRGSSSFHEFEVNVFTDPKKPIRQMGAFLITLAGIGAMFIMKFLY
jgi:hypothetical protein